MQILPVLKVCHIPLECWIKEWMGNLMLLLLWQKDIMLLCVVVVDIWSYKNCNHSSKCPISNDARTMVLTFCERCHWHTFLHYIQVKFYRTSNFSIEQNSFFSFFDAINILYDWISLNLWQSIIHQNYFTILKWSV